MVKFKIKVKISKKLLESNNMNNTILSTNHNTKTNKKNSA